MEFQIAGSELVRLSRIDLLEIPSFGHDVLKRCRTRYSGGSFYCKTGAPFGHDDYDRTDIIIKLHLSGTVLRGTSSLFRLAIERKCVPLSLNRTQAPPPQN